MSLLDNIKSVAKYESKLLMRSWFYRVFLILAVLFLCVFNFFALINSSGTYWIMKALPSNIPYINLLFLNTGQAIIAVFLSSEFLKTDKKLDTSEVFYVHPLSNAEYVVGKIWGNLNVFIRLNLLIITIVVLFNIASGVTIDWAAYVTYFFIISVPTLIYIFGLSVALMLILKNQAITFVILLGYIGITVFYLGTKFYYLFDYMAFNLPLVKSLVVGFSNWGALVNHRCIYLSLGLGFLCVSIFLFRRLPNTKYGRYRWLALSISFFIASGIFAFNHVNAILKGTKMRALYTEINNKYVNTPKMVIEDYDITVEQRPETISAEVTMYGVAMEDASVFTFCLNPGLQVRGINEQGKELSFEREKQIIFVDFGRKITQGDPVSFTMRYDGRIDEGFCFLDIPPEVLLYEYSVESYFKIDKKYSFQTKDYILFTPETYWYPCPGTSYSSESPDWQQAYFSNFQLTVKTLNGLQAISQGTLLYPEERSIVPSKLPTKSKKLADKIQERTRQNTAGQGRNNQGGGFQGVGVQGGGRNFQDGGGAQQRGPQGGGGQGGQGQGRGGQGGGGMQQQRGFQDTTRMQRRFQDGEGMPQRGAPDSARMQEMMRRFQDGEGMPQRGAPDSARMQEMMRRFQDGEGMPQRGSEDGDRMPRRGTEDSARMQRRSQDRESSRQMALQKDSLFIFKTDFPTPSITLIIGDYEQKKIDVDSIEYSVWHLRDHNYFYPIFEDIVDTIPGLIRGRKDWVEYQYSLDYSYNRFSIVEVPVQFNSYARTWSQAQEKMQPEMVLYPEKGCLFNNADFTSSFKNVKLNANRNGRELSDRDASMQVFGNFVFSSFQNESSVSFSGNQGLGSLGLSSSNDPRMNNIAINFSTNPYFVFPQLYNFRYNIFSSDWSISNRLIEVYLQNKSDDDNRMRQTSGISNSEKANLLMEKRPFKELLADVEYRSLLDNIVALKANTLFATAESSIGNREFRDSLRAVLQRNIFANIRFENLLDTLGMIAGVDLIKPLESWNNPITLPVYIIETPDVMRITNPGVEVYVIKLLITNNSDVEGIINVQIGTGAGAMFSMGGGGGGRGTMSFGSAGLSSLLYDPRTDRKISFAPHETKRLVSVWEDAPRMIRINTLVSGNLPSQINLQVSNMGRERNVPIMAEGDYIVSNYSYNLPGEVIVDNEDTDLFELSKPDIVGLLPQWLEETSDNTFPYSGVSNWRPPLQWTLTTGDRYYGTHIRSAYVVKNGNGSQTATWKIPVPSSGNYELYYYLTRMDDGRNRGGGGPGGGGPGGQPQQQNRGGSPNTNTNTNNNNSNNKIEYQFKVKYDDYEENAYINFKNVTSDGWWMLNRYYFNEGDTVRVTLNNNTKSRLIAADAVKIVKRLN